MLEVVHACGMTGAVTVRITGVSAAAVNVLRHALLKDVPSYAIERVKKQKQCNCEWEYEFIAHRVGQLPVAADDHDGTADGAVFAVDVTAPAAADQPCTVTWVTDADFVNVRQAGKPRARIVTARTPAEAAAVAPGHFLVAPLLPGQRLRLKALVRRSTAREGGTRWACVFVAQESLEPDMRLRVETTGSVTPLQALAAAAGATARRFRALAGAITAV